MLLSPILLSSCQGFSAKIDLQYGQMIHDDVDYIDYQTLKEKIDSKETFIVTVYAKNCSCWSMLHTNLIDYISKNHIQVFAVNYDNFHDASGKTLDNFNLNIPSSSKFGGLGGCCPHYRRIKSPQLCCWVTSPNFVARPAGLGPATFWFVVKCSIQLSYERV